MATQNRRTPQRKSASTRTRNRRNTKSRRRKVLKFPRQLIHWNIGTVTFGIIFIYLMINVFLYMRSDTISTYQVTSDKMQKTITTTGVVLRTEKIITNKTDGYLSYYAPEGSRVAKKEYVYSVDESGEVYDYLSKLSTENNILDEDSYENLKEIISTFNNYYKDDSFYEVYDFKYNLNNAILSVTNDKTMKQLDDALKEAGISDSYSKVSSPKSGLVSYLMDGFETLTPETVTKQTFDQSSYKKEQLKTSNLVEAGSPVYKLITGDTWDIMIPVTAKEAALLKERSTVQVNFLKDDTTLPASVSLIENKDGTYARLHFTDYLIRYMDTRYLNVEVILSSISGLKVPNTALVKRELFRIPVSYLSAGSNSTDYQFTVRTSSSKNHTSVKQIPADLVMKDSKYCYVSTVPKDENSLTKGMILIQNNSKKTFKVSSTKEIQGVYCVNKGYAAFKMVNVLYSNEDYSIVEADTDTNALMIYDYIILNSKTIGENDKIY